MLEQHTSLYNRSDVRHRFYWWTNAGVEVWDDTKILYPMEFTASHGFTVVDTWPIDSAGHDLSVVGNHKYGPVSRFSHGSREPYMGVYHPRTKSGVVHYSSPIDLPSKKLWSWSSDADGLDWRRALSDNNSAYIEIQAGPFRNQETYGFLEPQQTLKFSEYWMPMLDLGGLSRATPDALLNLTPRAGAGGHGRPDHRARRHAAAAGGAARGGRRRAPGARRAGRPDTGSRRSGAASAARRPPAPTRSA